VEDTGHHTSAAVLIRSTPQWSTALRTTLALLESGATVKLFFLGYAPMTIENPVPDSWGVACYADDRQQNMDYLPMDAIAAILKQCDLVIPV
jgi:hypothetical protein